MMYIQITLSILFFSCCYISYLIGYGRAMKYFKSLMEYYEIEIIETDMED